MMVLKVQKALNALTIVLEQKYWSPETITMWKTTGQQRAMEFVLRHKTPEMALQVLEQKIQGVCQLLSEDPPKKVFTYGVNPDKKIMQLSIHLMLLPSFFIRQCQMEAQQLDQWSGA